jgi:peptidoglycan/LPS O-acetylase OafA/YrhL
VPRYRADIDGLRAIAVVAVIFFHLQTGFVQGGYVGVDVFFVISGYLITGIVYEEVVLGSFSVGRFYERRIRRIFPALFTVVAACAIAGWFMLLPSEYEAFGRSVIATTLFVSNQFFLTQSNYFAAAAGESRVLLHTWSLAVEEQFYLVFPLFLLVLQKTVRGRTVAVVWIVTVTSFAASVWLLHVNPNAAFYFAPVRAWELLIGCLIALGAFPALKNYPARNVLGALGLILIGAAVFGFRSYTPFPGVAALAPVIGAALIIYSGNGPPTLVARVLGLRALVFVGLISYSLYLWHWPIIVFTVLGLGHSLHIGERVAVLAACVLASTASWYFVERPFRKRGAVLVWARLLPASLAAMAVFCALGVATIDARGLPGRFSTRANDLAAYLEYDPAEAYRQGHCFMLAATAAEFDAHECLGRDSRRPNDLLIGDSHAAHLWYGLQNEFPRTHFQQATAVGCKPLIGSDADKACRAMLGDNLLRSLAKLQPDRILLSAEWTPSDLQPLLRTIQQLRTLHQSVYVFGPSQEYTSSLPRLLAMNVAHAPVIAAGGEGTPSGNDQIFDTAIRASGATYISVYRTMCPSGRCATTTDRGIPIYFDTGHFTEAGSMWVAQKWKREGVLGPARPASVVAQFGKDD